MIPTTRNLAVRILCIRQIVFPFLLVAMTAVAVPATAAPYSVVSEFTPSYGRPVAPLFRAADGTLFGTTTDGGDHGLGSVFRLEPSGGITILHSFNSTDGANPQAGVIESGGFLYGTTQKGGATGFGTIFSLDPSSRTLATLHSFSGNGVFTGLFEHDGALYGTTTQRFDGTDEEGTIYKLELASGVVTTLHIFRYGFHPQAGVIEKDGFLYGTTQRGGASREGTVYKFELASGILSTLHSFDGENGAEPRAGVIAYGGFLWGTASKGGPVDAGVVYRVALDSVNAAPVLASIGNRTVAEGETLHFRLAASDADANELAYRATGMPDGATLDGTTGNFNWRPRFDQAGTYEVTFIVSDGTDSDFETITITVTDADPPETILCVPNATTACVLGGRFSVQVRYRHTFDHGPVTRDALVRQTSGFADANFETAFFYFNSPNNIEVIVKMLDQGNANAQGQQTIAVLYGTATPLLVEVIITDAELDRTTRVYRSEFGTMRGQTDFTAFVK